MILMEMVTVDFVDIRPTEIKPADCPKQKLNPDKNTQKAMNSPSDVLMFLRMGEQSIGY
jgi:hypothetical protein